MFLLPEVQVDSTSSSSSSSSTQRGSAARLDNFQLWFPSLARSAVYGHLIEQSEVSPCASDSGNPCQYELSSRKGNLVADTLRSVVSLVMHQPNSNTPPPRLRSLVFDSFRRRVLSERFANSSVLSPDLLDSQPLREDDVTGNLTRLLAGFAACTLTTTSLPALIAVPGSDSKVATTIDAVIEAPDKQRTTLIHFCFENSTRASSSDCDVLCKWIATLPISDDKSATEFDWLASIESIPRSNLAREVLLANFASFAFRRELGRVGAPMPAFISVVIAFGEPGHPRASLLHLGGTGGATSLIIPDRALAICLLAVSNTMSAVRSIANRFGAPTKLRGVAWNWSLMREQARRYPEVQIGDTTFNTNALKWPLMQVVCANSDGHNVTAMQAILPDETQQSMNWAIAHAFPLLIGSDAAQAAHVFLTDENQQLIRAVDVAKNPRAHCLHSECARLTCCWHKLELYALNNLRRLFRRDEDFQLFMRIIRAAYKEAESDAEVDALFDCIREIADPDQSNTGAMMSSQSYPTLESFLDSLQGAETRKTWSWSWRIRLRTLGIRTSGRNEGDNSALKGNHKKDISAVTSPSDLVTRSLQLATSRDTRDADEHAFRSGRRRIDVDSRLKRAEDTLTTYAFELLEVQFNQAVCYQYELECKGVWRVERKKILAADDVSMADEHSSSSSSSSNPSSSFLASSSSSSSSAASGPASSSTSASSSAASCLEMRSDGSPKIAARVRVVRVVRGADGEVYLHCSCGYFTYMMLPCRHVICIKHLLLSKQGHDWHFRWTIKYRDDDVVVPRSFGDGRLGASVHGISDRELPAADEIPLASSTDFMQDRTLSTESATAEMVASAKSSADVPPKTAAHERHGVAKERLMPELTALLSNLQLLEADSFSTALEHCADKLQDLNAELVTSFGDGTAVRSSVKAGGSGRDAVRHVRRAH